MMIEEQIEQSLRREAVGIGAKIVQFALMLLYNISRWALRQNGKLLHSIGAGLQKIVYKQLHEGKISEKTLQREYGNIHQTKPIAKQDLKTVEQSLKKSGIAYAVEKVPVQEGQEPTYIIHFKGEDLAHVEHAIQRAAAQLQHDINVLPAPPEQTQQTQEAPDAPAPSEPTYTENPKEDPKKSKNKNNPKTAPNKINQKDVLDKLNKKTASLKAQQTVKPQMPVKNRRR